MSKKKASKLSNKHKPKNGNLWKREMVGALEERTKGLLRRNSRIDMDDIEDKIHKTSDNLNARIKRLESAFITFSDTIDAMKKEREKLLRDKQRLEAENKELEMRIAGVDVGAIAAKAAEKVQKGIHENVELMQHVASGKEEAYEKKMQVMEEAKETDEEDEYVIKIIKSGKLYHLDKVKSNNLARLFLFIRSTKTAKTSDAARALGLNEGMIEGMAEALKQHKIVAIQYPAFGKPILIAR